MGIFSWTCLAGLSDVVKFGYGGIQKIVCCHQLSLEQGCKMDSLGVIGLLGGLIV